MLKNFIKKIGFLLIAMMATACAGHEQTGTGGGLYEFEGSIRLYGGRGRVVGLWSDVRDNDLTLRISSQNGTSVEALMSSAEGDISLGDLNEGEQKLNVQLVKNGEAVWSEAKFVTVLGETYENGLLPWSHETYRFAGTVFNVEFADVVYGG